MTEVRALYSHEDIDPCHPTRQVPSAAVAGSDEAADVIIADLNELRVV